MNRSKHVKRILRKINDAIFEDVVLKGIEHIPFSHEEFIRSIPTYEERYGKEDKEPNEV